MHVGDHGGLLTRKDRGPLGSELPVSRTSVSQASLKSCVHSSDLAPGVRAQDARANAAGHRRVAQSGGFPVRRARSRRPRTARGPGKSRNRIAGRLASQRSRRGNVEQVVEHLAAGLAEQGVVGADRLDQRIEPRADPVQAADPHPAAGCGLRRTIRAVAATWRNRRASSSPRSSPSSTSSAKPSLASSDGKSRRERRVGVVRQPDRPAQVGDAERQVAAEPPAQPGRARAPRASQAARFSGAWKV